MDYTTTALCLALMAREIALLRDEIDDLSDYEEEEEAADGVADDERQAAEAMVVSASTDDEQAEWMDEAAIQPHPTTPATDDEYDGSITPAPSRSSTLPNHTAGPHQQLPFHSIAADRRQLCEQHGDECPSDHTQQSRAAIVTTTPRHVTPPFDSRHQQLVNTLTSPAAATQKKHGLSLLSPPLVQPHSQHCGNNKENVRPTSPLHTYHCQPTLLTSPQSAFSAVGSRTPPHSPTELSQSASLTGTAFLSKRRKTVHASLNRSFQSLPVEQQQSRGSVTGSGSGISSSGTVSQCVGSRRMPR